MQQTKSLSSKLASSLLLIICLSSCQGNNFKFEVPDVNVITQLLEGKAFGTTSVSKRETLYSKEEWDEMKIGSQCLMAQDWAKIKTAIEAACLQAGPQCSQETYEMIKSIK